MRTIEMAEILELYKKCNVDANNCGRSIRTSINKGTLANKLNTGTCFNDSNAIKSTWSNSTLPHTKEI